MSPKRVGFVEAVKLYFYNYSNFSGRSTESEFWWVVLFNILVSIPLCIIDGIVYSVTDSFIFTYIPSGLWTLVNLVPGLSLYARRLHDTGHSALWLVISVLLPVGAVFLTFYTPPFFKKCNIVIIRPVHHLKGYGRFRPHIRTGYRNIYSEEEYKK